MYSSEYEKVFIMAAAKSKFDSMTASDLHGAIDALKKKIYEPPFNDAYCFSRDQVKALEKLTEIRIYLKKLLEQK